MPVDEREYCGAETRQSNQDKSGKCKRKAGAGTDHLGVGNCSKHLGSTIAHRKAAIVPMVSKTVREEGYSVEEYRNPTEALMVRTVEAERFADALRARISSLSDWKHEDDKGAQEVQAEVAEYGRALDRVLKQLVDIHKLGLEDRRVKLEESSWSAVAQMQVETLAAMGLEDRVEEFKRVFRELVAKRNSV